MTRIAFVHTGSFFHLADLADPAVVAADVVDVYAPVLTAGMLDGFDGVYVAARLHPGVLPRVGPLLVDYLSGTGRKMYIDGENHVGDWLPGTTETPRGTNFWSWRTGEDLGRRSVHTDHPFWSWLTDRSVHWHYHSVLAHPAAATALVALEPVPHEQRIDPWGRDYRAIDGHPNTLLYHDDATFRAEVVVSTMDAAYHHGSGFMPGASQLFYRMLRWLAA